MTQEPTQKTKDEHKTGEAQKLDAKVLNAARQDRAIARKAERTWLKPMGLGRLIS